MVYNPPVKKILITSEQIDKRVKELAAQISEDYKDQNPVIVGVLRGSVLFFSNLVKNLQIDCHLDFMALSSYSGTSSSGKVRFVMDLREDIKGRPVIIVEDIVDTGITARYLLELLKTRQPASIEICSLLDKPSNRQVEIKAKYTGFEIANEFVIGYGLDYNGLYRNLPYIGVFDESKK